MRRAHAARKMLGIPEPAVEFKVHPEYHGGFHFTVKIFSSIARMRLYLKHIRPDKGHREDLAFTDNRSNALVFCWSYFDTETITHELLHATFWWAHKRGLKPETCMRWGSSTHERLADAIGYMAMQIERKARHR